MGKYDPKTGTLVDPSAPETRPTIADSLSKPQAATTAPVAPVPPVGSGQAFTLADVMAIIAQMRQPNEVEQFRFEQEKKKVDQEKAAEIAKAERARRNSILVEQQKASSQSICGHTKANGRTAFAGQVNSDGYWRPLCIQCGKILPKVKAPTEWLTGGINTQMGPDIAGAMGWLNERTLLAWHRSTVPNCQEPCCKPLAAIA